jgi:HD-GYP domain-containing protein (c-di-GMP phosphodiesterase class II)
MASPPEVWFFKHSPAENLARTLGRRYPLHGVDLPQQRPGRKASRAEQPTGPAVWLADPTSKHSALLLRLARRQPDLRLIAVISGLSSRRGHAGRPSGTPRSTQAALNRDWFACVPHNAPAVMIERAVAGAFASINSARRENAARDDLRRAEQEREELNRIGVALSSTHDVSALLEIILAKTREITGADAGSLYVVETAPRDSASRHKAGRRLRFKLTQNDSRQFHFSEYTVPINEDSLAGYAALHGEVIALDDAYALPAESPYRFNPRYDREAGYRTRSLLTVPMKNPRGEVTGVVQLLNCKRNPAARLLAPADLDREVQPFPARAISLAESLASQAAVAYENGRLYQDIEALFEGFVQAAVTAIEQRDPTTSGHSLRVSQMTTSLAEIVDRSDTGPYLATRFTRDQMKEIRYAALLHDFGKVGVREEVLVKAKKLYPVQLDMVQSRFDYVRKDLEVSHERQKVQALLDGTREQALRTIARLDHEFRRRSLELDHAFAAIVEANEPTVLASQKFERLFEIARQSYQDPRGAHRPLLSAEEVRFLSIPRGSLDTQERQQIESHVLHSFRFLMQIPWTREIRDVPEIARAHHEKLNGTGYPFRLKGEEIPVQARMMTICDIFDALAAADRPYKRAVPPERALSILQESVRNNELDAGLFHLFLQGRVYELAPARA